MKRILTSKAGVTLLEGVIALGLLALIAGGAFAVLLASSRQTTQPDIREEMALAVEKVNNQLKALMVYDNNLSTIRDDLVNKLPGGLLCLDTVTDLDPLASGHNHDLTCQLPPICDRRNSQFYYTVASKPQSVCEGSGSTNECEVGLAAPGLYDVTYTIECNGYKL